MSEFSNLIDRLTGPTHGAGQSSDNLSESEASEPPELDLDEISHRLELMQSELDHLSLNFPNVDDRRLRQRMRATQNYHHAVAGLYGDQIGDTDRQPLRDLAPNANVPLGQPIVKERLEPPQSEIFPAARTQTIEEAGEVSSDIPIETIVGGAAGGPYEHKVSETPKPSTSTPAQPGVTDSGKRAIPRKISPLSRRHPRVYVTDESDSASGPIDRGSVRKKTSFARRMKSVQEYSDGDEQISNRTDRALARRRSPSTQKTEIQQTSSDRHKGVSVHSDRGIDRRQRSSQHR